MTEPAAASVTARPTSSASSAMEWLESLRKGNPRVGTALSTTQLLFDRSSTLNKPPVVMDVGQAYTKCGFAGEPHPRHIFETGEGFWRAGNDAVHASRRLLAKVFFKQLLVNPKERRVVLCENYLLPDVWKDALLNVLLCELGVRFNLNSFWSIHISIGRLLYRSRCLAHVFRLTAAYAWIGTFLFANY